jgi:hypothetical protein
MSFVSRTLAGIALLALGAVLLYGAVFESRSTGEMIWGVLWGGLLSGVALYLFWNSHEDDIEGIREPKDKNGKS